MGVSVTLYTTSNQTSANRDAGVADASHIADSGLQFALNRLTSQLSFTSPDAPTTGVLKGVGSIAPNSGILLPSCGTAQTGWTKVTFPDQNGQFIVCGDPTTLNDYEVRWDMKSIGTVTVAGKPISQTLMRSVTVDGTTATGDDISAWTRFFQNDNQNCLVIDHVSMPASIATRGDLCITDGGSITGSQSEVDVGGNVTIQGPNTPVGPRVPTAATGTSWTTPTNVYQSDSAYASYNLAPNGSTTTLVASGFGFTIPSTAVIRGVQVDIERHANNGSVRDSSVYLQKSGAQAGSNYAKSGFFSNWPTSDSTATYGGSTDLWGTTLTPTDVNASNFGVRVVVSNGTSSTRTVYIDQIKVTITYTAETSGNIGSSGTPVSSVNVAGTCKFNNYGTHRPCGNADKVWASNITTSPPADNLEMPTVDLATWFANAKPGPKHTCTNSPTSLSPLQFDNDNSSASNNSVHYNDTTEDMTPDDRSYTCKVIENGITVGELSWDLPNRVLTINGTIFFDGDVRFDSDGAVAHYQGRGLIYAAGNVEFDELVCAGGSGTSSCYPNMQNWNPDQNYMVIMSGGDSEYDQGGTGCPNSQYGRICPSGYSHPVSGFQGVVAATGQCLIHERFQLSGPVLCQDISLPYESDGWPTYYTFPVPNSLVNGQQYVSMSSAHAWKITPNSIGNG